MAKNLVSKDFIFKNINGQLKFVGDFEGYYNNEADPWGQKGKDKRLKNYYNFSRKRLINTIKTIENEKSNILEIGSGLGFVTNKLKKHFPCKNITGIDISKTAVKKAKELFPNLNFLEGNICSNNLELKNKYDIIIVSQILWYILEKLPIVFQNIEKLLNSNGYFIFINGFLKEQRYGREIIDGFDGLIQYILNNHDNYKIIKADIDYSNQYLNFDGIAMFQKKN
jgi:SAM-dependent methyltransferase